MVDRARWLVMLPRTSATGTPGLAAEHRDDGVVDVAGGDAAGSDGEQRVDPLAGGAVGELRLVGAGGLPGVDGLAEDQVDRLGEGGAGLVGRDVEQADRVAGQDLLRVAGDGCPVVPPARTRSSGPAPYTLTAAVLAEAPNLSSSGAPNSFVLWSRTNGAGSPVRLPRVRQAVRVADEYQLAKEPPCPSPSALIRRRPHSS